jgi:aryl-phospho-beta-D-glucosidase BglC (GH1 family)
MAPRTTHAATLKASLPNAAALRLPASAFPRGAKIQNGRSGNLAADRAGTLHTQSMSALGRVGGVIQTAGWNVVSRRARRAMSIQYVASIFPTEDQAAGAYDDARISLWENGHPEHVQGLQTQAFAVQERSGHTSVHMVAYHGQVELELRLRYLRALDGKAVHTSLVSLGHAGQVASHLAAKLTNPAISSSVVQPPVMVAPSGVGPVVKSPSLMALDGPTADSGAILYPGRIRAAEPPVSRISTDHPSLATNGSALRYARTMHEENGAEVYNTAALFPTPAAATNALTDMAASTDGAGFRRVDTSVWRGSLPYLGSADAVIMWQGSGESVLAFRQGNVVEILATTAGGPGDLAPIADRLAATIPSWLSTRGTQIVDHAGHPVYLNGLNWYGAEEGDFVVGGLDYAPYETILQAIEQRGFNSIRIPFSNQMVEQNPVVTAHLAANPSLQGLHALDILDRIIQYAGAIGLSVILDDHRSTAGWSSQPNGLWYDTGYPDSSFVRDWTLLAQRYAASNVVIGADLFNEPHATATWGDGNIATDWRLAAQRAGNAALAVNPHLLIMVEGVQYYGTAPSYWWGGNLMGVATAPVVLQYVSGTQAHDRLVYSVHDYGPDMCGGGCPWFNATTTYDALAATWDKYWGYVSADPTASYAAPLWVGEFGTCNQTQDCVQSSVPGSQGQWFSSLVRYIGAKTISWTYWSANGTMSTGGDRIYGNLDFYGYFTRDWGAPVPWLDAVLRTILNEGSSASPSTP